MTFKNRKSGNIATLLQHIQHYFNEEGEIVREDYYFNPLNFLNNENIKAPI